MCCEGLVVALRAQLKRRCWDLAKWRNSWKCFQSSWLSFRSGADSLGFLKEIRGYGT